MSPEPDLKRIEAERERLEGAWPDEWVDGARCAFHQEYPGQRAPGGYPKGFNGWPLERRNAWFAGYNVGFGDRLRFMREKAGGDG